jgi:hypothetical protein
LQTSAGTRFPATGHRFVEADQVPGDAALLRHEALLLAEERALRVENSLEVDHALAVLHVGDVEGASRRLYRFVEDRGELLSSPRGRAGSAPSIA